MRLLNKVCNVSKYGSSQKVQDNSLQNVMKNVVLTAQCFALFPVNGITKDVNSLKFKWISLKMFYSMSTIILEAIYAIFISNSSQITFKKFFSLEVILWNVRAMLIPLFYLKLAREWPKLVKEWTDIEMAMVDYGPIPSLKLRIRLLGIIFIVTGIIEHGLFVYGGISKALSSMKDEDNFFQTYFKNLYGDFFNCTEYTHWKAILVEFLTLISTFIWQFNDVFIIFLTSALAERFRQISVRINSKQVLYEWQWRDIRKQYNKLTLLCRTLNRTVSEVVLLSFFGNVYFLSVNIFQSFTFGTTFEAFYLWCGILCTLFHFLLVCLYAAWVHEESMKPMLDILCVPVKNTSYEVDRLLYQMAEGNIAIYGGGLFKITRGTILHVASVILTLQLIFFQFKTEITSNIA